MNEKEIEYKLKLKELIIKLDKMENRVIGVESTTKNLPLLEKQIGVMENRIISVEEQTKYKNRFFSVEASIEITLILLLLVFLFWVF